MITVITASLPERGRLLAEAATSVARQTLMPSAWYVEIDHARRGPVDVLNGLAEKVDTEWLFRLDDDDILEADHFDTLRPYLVGDADIVYSWCRVEGPMAARKFQVPFDAEKLKLDNMIPSAACIRTDLWRKLGGYRHHTPVTKHEDWDFWLRALDAGATFRCVEIPTWTYRLHEDWQHRSLEERQP